MSDDWAVAMIAALTFCLGWSYGWLRCRAEVKRAHRGGVHVGYMRRVDEEGRESARQVARAALDLPDCCEAADGNREHCPNHRRDGSL